MILTIVEIFTMPVAGSSKKAIKKPPLLKKFDQYMTEISDPNSPARVPRSQADDDGHVTSPGKGSGRQPSDLKTDEPKPGMDASKKAMKAMKAMTAMKAMNAMKAMKPIKPMNDLRSLKAMKSPAAMTSQKDLKVIKKPGSKRRGGDRGNCKPIHKDLRARGYDSVRSSGYIRAAVHFTPVAPADRSPPGRHPPGSPVRHPSVLPSIVPPPARL